MSWIDNLIPLQSLVQKGDVQYTFMGIDDSGLYILYSVHYHLSRYEMEQWCKPVKMN